MNEDKIRVVRLIVYEGPRSRVETLVAKSIHGIKNIGPEYGPNLGVYKDVSIQGITLGIYPEVIDGEKEEDCCPLCGVEINEKEDVYVIGPARYKWHTDCWKTHMEVFASEVLERPAILKDEADWIEDIRTGVSNAG